MTVNLLVAIATIIIAWLLFAWLIRVFKVSLTTGLTIAAILLVLQIGFGIESQQVWQELIFWLERIREFIAQNLERLDR